MCIFFEGKRFLMVRPLRFKTPAPLPRPLWGKYLAKMIFDIVDQQWTKQFIFHEVLINSKESIENKCFCFSDSKTHPTPLPPSLSLWSDLFVCVYYLSSFVCMFVFSPYIFILFYLKSRNLSVVLRWDFTNTKYE